MLASATTARVALEAPIADIQAIPESGTTDGAKPKTRFLPAAAADLWLAPAYHLLDDTSRTGKPLLV